MFKKQNKCRYCSKEFSKHKSYKSYLYPWMRYSGWVRIFNPLIKYSIVRTDRLSKFITWCSRTSELVCKDCYLLNNFGLVKECEKTGTYINLDKMLDKFDQDIIEIDKEPTFHESKRLEDDGKQKVLVDIDETICFYSGKRRYDLAEPNQENIDKINKLFDDGWYIIYWTARGGSEASKKANRCYYDFTLNQLNDWGCKFHELSTGTKGNYIKPPTDLIIDDKAVTIDNMV